MRILMVCLGNICRSPLAEGILKHKLKINGLAAVVDSAGTSNYHIGSPPDTRTIINAKKNGVDISGLRGRQFSVSDFNKFDRIYVMDNQNYDNVKKLSRNNQDKLKVKLILEEVFPGQEREVPDPYYGGDAGFENVFQLLDNACNQIIMKLKQ